MDYKTLRFLIPALGAALLLSCEVEKLAPAGLDHGDEISPVTVSLQLAVDGEQNGTPQTRAIDDPDDVQDTQIHNMCILQYNGTGDDAPLVGDVHYLRSDVDPEDENYLNLNAVKLADSWGAEHTLVILTNTFTQLGGDQIKTLGGMLSLWRSFGGEADVFGHTGQAEDFPNDTDYYQRMNAIVVAVISNDSTIKGTLRRSMARINVVIDNDGTDNLQIRRVQLRNASMKDYYVTDYSYIDGNDDVQLLRDTPFQDEYLPSVPMRVDYVPRTWPGVEPSSTGIFAQPAQTGANTTGTSAGTGTATYRWYVASNMRGTSGNTLPSEKSMSPNVAGATYLWILATYGDDGDDYIVYKFYLGENLVNDYNLKPNTSYTYRLTFRGKGDTVLDKRVYDYGSVNIRLDANCYIVNPPVEGTRKYTFNVVHRPNIFWGGPSSGDRYGFYNNSQGQFPSNFIGTTEEWHARILWSDAAYDMNALLTRNSGTGAGNYMDANQRVELTIPSGITKGNMVIGVWTGDDPNVILWSWHIWITDYQPDDIVGHAPDAGVYLYNVNGGEVHRYRGGNWEGATARYRNGYIMDRSVGALDQKARSYNQRGGGFVYQFGRKDPFPGAITVYTYDADGTRHSLTGDNNVCPKIPYANTGTGGYNMPWSVNNPRTFITSYDNWTNDNAFGKGNTWRDPKISIAHVENEDPTVKSFFDPCPPGWNVPFTGVTSHFKGDSNGWSSEDNTVNFQWDVERYNGHNRGSGITYYPRGFKNDKNNLDAPTAFFPLTLYREKDGTPSSAALIWYDTPQVLIRNATQCYPTFDYGARTSVGGKIRCVRKSYQ